MVFIRTTQPDSDAVVLLEEVRGGQQIKDDFCDFSGIEGFGVCLFEGAILPYVRIGRYLAARLAMDRSQHPFGHIDYPAARLYVFQVYKKVHVVGGRSNIERHDRVARDFYCPLQWGGGVGQQFFIFLRAVGIDDRPAADQAIPAGSTCNQPGSGLMPRLLAAFPGSGGSRNKNKRGSC